MSQPNIDYYLYGTHVRFGDGCTADLDKELRGLGCNRPVVLMQARMATSERYARLREGLAHLAILEISDIPEHGSASLIESIALQARSHAADCIVAIGGGSVSDSAKALAMLLAEGGVLADHATRFTPPSSLTVPSRTKPKLPIITVPTTASGAEVTPSFGARDHDHKLLFWNRHLASTTLLIDPAFCQDVPMSLMRFTAMNGMAHCFEGMYSRNKSLVANGIALQSLALFSQALSGSDLEESEQRWRILLAGHLSGMVLSMARTCLHHAICHVIGGRHGIGHGAVNTVMLAHSLRFNESSVRADLAPALDVLNRETGSDCHCTADWVQATVRRLRLPDSLSSLGLQQADLPAIAEQTLGERGLAINPRPVTDASEILSIFASSTVVHCRRYHENHTQGQQPGRHHSSH